MSYINKPRGTSRSSSSDGRRTASRAMAFAKRAFAMRMSMCIDVMFAFVNCLICELFVI